MTRCPNPTFQPIAGARRSSEFKSVCRLGCFIFSPFLNFKMPGVPIGGILGKKFAPQFFFNYDVILRWSTTLKFLGSEIAWYGHISRTAHRRSTKLVSKCAEESISYTRCRATYTLSVSEKKLFQKKRILHLFLKQ